jgi:uncharacterized protein (TIGR03437 family)
LNGASLEPGPLAPGEVFTLLGSAIGPGVTALPAGTPSSTVLSDITVAFDGASAPLLFAAPGQINAVVPFGVAGKTTARLQVARQGRAIAQLDVPVAEASPAIFTLDGSGVGPGAILNQDAAINSPLNPAARGAIVTLFATGAGEMDLPGIDGELAAPPFARPKLSISILIGGLPASIVYAGAAPGQIAGVLQVNCVVPADAPTGEAVPILLRAGDFEGPAGVTLAVR